jgi:hypothetical protein
MNVVAHTHKYRVAVNRHVIRRQNAPQRLFLSPRKFCDRGPYNDLKTVRKAEGNKLAYQGFSRPCCVYNVIILVLCYFVWVLVILCRYLFSSREPFVSQWYSSGRAQRSPLDSPSPDSPWKDMMPAAKLIPGVDTVLLGIARIDKDSPRRNSACW